MQRVVALARESREFLDLMETGVLSGPDGQRAARPVAVRADGNVEIEVLAESPPTAGAGAWFAAVRPPSLTATFTPAVAVWLHGVANGWTMSVGIAVAAMVGVLLLQVAVNLLNDVEDHRRLIDLPGTLGGAGFIQRGVLRPTDVRRVAIVAAVAGLALGLPAFARDPAAFAFIAALAVVGGLGYSTGPGLKYKALGDLSVIALCGPVLTIGTSLAAFGRFDSFVIVIGLALGFAAVGLLHVNNFQDMAVDRSRAVSTLALKLGATGSRVYLVAVYVFAFAAWIVGAALAGLPVWAVVVPVLAALPVARLVRGLLSASDPTMLRDARMHAAQAHLLFGVVICGVLGAVAAI